MALFGKKQQFSRPGQIQRPSPIQKPMPKSPAPPKTLFEEKKDWSRYELKRKIEKTPAYIRGAGPEIYSHQERKKMLDELFPQKRFQGYISERETKTRLRELRGQEHKAKAYNEKIKLSRLRQFLEKETGLKGKY